VITAVHPHATGWATAMPWTGILAPHGLLAVITHSDHTGSRLVDPIADLTGGIGGIGLALLDHVILLHTPIGRAPAPPPATGPTAAPPVLTRRAHADLLLFAWPRSQGDVR
jgi:hypothetical protein